MKHVDMPASETFGVTDNELTPEVYAEAITLCISVYSKKDDDFDEIVNLRAHKFLNLLPF